MPQIKNLIFEGGGAAGVAYAGAIAELERLEEDGLFSMAAIQRVGGASVGSITALLVCLKYTSAEIATRIKAIDMNTLKDDDIGVIRDLNRLVNEYGFYKGYALLDLIKGFIRDKTGSESTTFMQLKNANFKDLYVMTTKVYTKAHETTCKPFIFSWENAPDTPVAPVILASAAIPVFYKAVRLHEERPGAHIQSNKHGHVYVDGGTLNNFPISMFDSTRYITGEESKNADEPVINMETLGLRVDNPDEIRDLRDNQTIPEDEIPAGKPMIFFAAVLKGVAFGQQEYIFNSQGVNRQRSIFIDRLGTTATDFDMTNPKKDLLITSGSAAVRGFFAAKVAASNPRNFPNAGTAAATPPVEEVEEKKRKSCCIL